MFGLEESEYCLRDKDDCNEKIPMVRFINSVVRQEYTINDDNTWGAPEKSTFKLKYLREQKDSLEFIEKIIDTDVIFDVETKNIICLILIIKEINEKIKCVPRPILIKIVEEIELDIITRKNDNHIPNKYPRLLNMMIEYYKMKFVKEEMKIELEKSMYCEFMKTARYAKQIGIINYLVNVYKVNNYCDKKIIDLVSNCVVFSSYYDDEIEKRVYNNVVSINEISRYMLKLLMINKIITYEWIFMIIAVKNDIELCMDKDEYKTTYDEIMRVGLKMKNHKSLERFCYWKVRKIERIEYLEKKMNSIIEGCEHGIDITLCRCRGCKKEVLLRSGLCEHKRDKNKCTNRYCMKN